MVRFASGAPTINSVGLGDRSKAGTVGVEKKTSAALAFVICAFILAAGCGGKPRTNVAESLRCATGGQVYLVPLGEPATYSLDGLPEYYKEKFGLKVTVLPPVPLASEVEDHERGQVVAEKLVEMMKRSQAILSEDLSAFLIGITEKDMYIAAYDWQYAFNWRQQDRFAVVSVARLGPAPERDLEIRLRKLVTKNIVLLYYQLPLSADPTSVLYGQITSASDIDRMSDSPVGGDGLWKPLAEDGDPCVTITQPAEKLPVWRFDCAHAPPRDGKTQLFEVDLRLGLFVQRQMDFFIEEPFPLALGRTYRPQDKWSRAFGIGTNHPLDIFLVGDAPRLSYVELILEDGGRVHYRRVSPGTGHANAEFAANLGSGNRFSSSRIRWNGEGWDLNLADGWTMVFPASDQATRSQQAALVGIHHSDGRSFRLVRDASGNLLNVTTPGGNSVEFDYDSAGRVSRAKDNRGRSVTYEYDPGGRLVDVEDSNGQVLRYSYDSKDQMLTVEDRPGHALMTNKYDAKGNLVQQTLGDGRVLTYRYVRSIFGALRATEVTDPRGCVTRFAYDPSGYTRSLPQPPAN